MLVGGYRFCAVPNLRHCRSAACGVGGPYLLRFPCDGQDWQL